MNDVLDRLAALRFPSPAVDVATVAGDVRRGRRALHRRRAARGGVLAACALTVVGVAGTTLRDPAPQVQEHVRLVTYTGEQLPGFTIAKAPEGFVLQGATSYNLNVVRPGDTSSIDVFEDKIVVMLEWNGESAPMEEPPATEPPEVANKPLPEGVVALGRVDGRVVYVFNDGRREFVTPAAGDEVVPNLAQQAEPPAVEPFDVDGESAKVTTNEEGTTTLRYVHGDYTLAIQAWPTLGLTEAQLREFADGVSVTADAQPGRG